ncbi:MAG: Gx transporter family protein [Oscillibacter sp.]|nr:Gx transporter family protein [Oscillibacter sp.]
MRTKKLTTLSLLTALALIFSFVESQLPPLTAVPGVKMGLPNVVVVFALYKLGWREAAGLSLVRVALVSVLFGTAASFLYSLAGAVLSFAGMVLLKRTGRFSHVGVSVAGGVLHNVGQILMASVILETNIFAYYLPFLLVSGTAAGIAIGLLSSAMVRRVPLG